MRLKRPKTNFEQEASSKVWSAERKGASCEATRVAPPHLYNMQTESPHSMDLLSGPGQKNVEN